MNNVYEHYRGDEEFVKRMLDRIERMQRSYRVIYTPFLTSAQQHICHQLLGKQVLYMMDGGYEQAEYKCLAIYPDEGMKDAVCMPIACLKASFSERYSSLQHRDVLGALMNLGIRREQFGDILVQTGTIYVFVHEDIRTYVMQNCRRIGRSSVCFEEFSGTITHEPSLLYRQVFVSSLRLDALVSAITSLSRAKAQNMIRLKQVKVDQVLLEDCDYLCNNNSILSIRGYGRFQISLKDRKTKKGNIVVEIGTYV